MLTEKCFFERKIFVLKKFLNEKLRFFGQKFSDVEKTSGFECRVFFGYYFSGLGSKNVGFFRRVFGYPNPSLGKP